MNAYWYIYMRARGSELAKLIGEDAMRRRRRRRRGSTRTRRGPHSWASSVARQKAAEFADVLEELVRRHGAEYKIPDSDLREQIKAAAARAVRGAYAGFLKANGRALAGARREVLPVDVVEGMVGRVFDEMVDGVAGSVGRARTGNRGRRE
jgi:exocyst complex component 7